MNYQIDRELDFGAIGRRVAASTEAIQAVYLSRHRVDVAMGAADGAVHPWR